MKPYDGIKRVFDVVLSFVLLVVLSPLLLVLALGVLLRMGRPILYRQKRPGKRARPFTLYKFRSMRGSAGGVGDVAAVASDEARLTGFGRFLRASSLDELPELFNILRGDMSFVGPRPLLMEYLPLYSEGQARRHEVRPGLTGLAQVSGRNAVSWPERFALDVQYVDERSFGLDLRIMARTVGAVLSRRGINSDEHTATMDPFRGN
jgi:lipopolysaccharide/colanic/teichoic acid biosynthesis glycosyltransferase